MPQVNIDDGVYRELEKLAEQSGKDVEMFIAEALRQYVASGKKPVRLRPGNSSPR